MFPLGSVLLPGERLPLHIFEPRYQELLRDCLTTEDPSFGVVLIERGHEAGGGDARHAVATIAHIVAHQDIGDGRHIVECVGAERIRVDAWLEDDPYPRADARAWPDEDDAPVLAAQFDVLHEKIRELYRLIGKLADAEGSEPPGEPTFSEIPADAGERLFTLASMIPLGESDRNDVLSAPSAAARIVALTEGLDNITDIVRFRLQ